MAEPTYVVVSFDRATSGELVPLEPLWVSGSEAASRRTFETAVRHAGALAFSAVSALNAEKLDVGTELVKYGDVIHIAELRWSSDGKNLERKPFSAA